MPKAAVNQIELAALSMRRPYQPSISALARGENRRATDFVLITSAGLGVSVASAARAVLMSGSVLISFQNSKYCRAVSASATRWPTLVWPKKPEGVKLV